jgi:hypothetical protein
MIEGKSMDTENRVLLDKANDIYIEIGSKLNFDVEESKLSPESIFVGGKKGEYIVITSPPGIEFLKDDLLKRNNVDIKYRYHGQIFVFQTKLIEVVSEPIQLILLEYPIHVRNCDLRAQKRANCFISAIIEVEPEKNNEEIIGVIKDISKAGCRLLVRTSKSAENIFQMNDQITLKCHFPGITGEQDAIGKVRDIRIKGEETSIGIHFSDTMWWVPPYG